METSFIPSISANSAFTINNTAAKHESRLNTFFNNQAKNVTAWFLASLMFQGIFFLPIPVALAYYFGAPGYLLAITLVLFFANIIAGMASAGIRAVVLLFAISVAVHLLLLAFYIV